MNRMNFVSGMAESEKIIEGYRVECFWGAGSNKAQNQAGSEFWGKQSSLEMIDEKMPVHLVHGHLWSDKVTPVFAFDLDNFDFVPNNQ